MKKYNIAKRTGKEKSGKGRVFFILETLLLVFLFPYVSTCIWGHSRMEGLSLTTEMSNRTKNSTRTEAYIAQCLSEVMPVYYKEEALKAMAVVLRTELLSKWEDETFRDNVLKKGDALIRGNEFSGEKECYQRAVLTTEGLCLYYDGMPAEACYYQVSNGHSRAASENEFLCPYPYLVHRELADDRSAPGFEQTIAIGKEEYQDKIAELFHVGEVNEYEVRFHRDASGYVVSVMLDEKVCDGEVFRRALHLPSAAFQITEKEFTICFTTKGIGHGYGLGVYGANCKAVNGEDYKEILEDFFPGTKLIFVESLYKYDNARKE